MGRTCLVRARPVNHPPLVITDREIGGAGSAFLEVDRDRHLLAADIVKPALRPLLLPRWAES